LRDAKRGVAIPKTHPPKPYIQPSSEPTDFEEAISLQQTEKETREVVRSRKKRLGAVAALIALIGSFMALAIANAPIARADTTQNNGCLGVTGDFSTFAVPITGTATPNPVTGTLPGPTYPSVTLSGTAVSIGVDSTLIGAGVTTGIVSAADSLADIGAVKNDGTPATPLPGDPNPGVDAVTSAVGSVTLKITGSNTVEGVQTASNTAPVAVTFYVTADSLGGSVVVYTSISSPPSTTADPLRTGTVLSGSLVVPVPLGNTVWTPTGASPIVFAEQNSAPSPLTTPVSAANQNAAPLILLPKINGVISAPFHCWPGTSTGTTPNTALVPTGSSAIDSVVVNAPITPATCATPQAASVGGGQSTAVTPSCTNINPPFVLGTSTVLITTPAAHGSATVQPGNTIAYSNDGLGASSDTFQYTVDNGHGPSNTVLVNVAVLNNQCTVSGPSCSLKQVLLLPVLPSTLSMSEAAAYGNPSFSTAVLGGVVTGSSCVPGPLQLNGQPRQACGAMNPLTIVNARGTDAQWAVTAQVTDFIDGTRGPTDTCSSPPSGSKNINQTPKDNHCIPGDNLGWVPLAQITDAAVPGDTAAISAGGVILPAPAVSQTPPAFPPNPLGVRNNTNNVTDPFSILNLTTPGPGLHDVAQTLCSSPVNQSGGTFQCDAGLLMAVPASTAASLTGYTATLTLTLA